MFLVLNKQNYIRKYVNSEKNVSKGFSFIYIHKSYIHSVYILLYYWLIIDYELMLALHCWDTLFTAE